VCAQTNALFPPAWNLASALIDANGSAICEGYCMLVCHSSDTAHAQYRISGEGQHAVQQVARWHMCVLACLSAFVVAGLCCGKLHTHNQAHLLHLSLLASAAASCSAQSCAVQQAAAAAAAESVSVAAAKHAVPVVRHVVQQPEADG